MEYLNMLSFDEWQLNNNLACCRAESRGVWIEMLCCMSKSRQKGVLHLDYPSLARLTRSTIDEVVNAINDLEKNGVFSRGHEVSQDLPSEAIVCREMYRRWRLSQVRAEAGRKGGLIGGLASGDCKRRYKDRSQPSENQDIIIII